jgi:hypothetical protein
VCRPISAVRLLRNANPFAIETPILSPVYEPGPLLTTTASSLEAFNPHRSEYHLRRLQGVLSVPFHRHFPSMAIVPEVVAEGNRTDTCCRFNAKYHSGSDLFSIFCCFEEVFFWNYFIISVLSESFLLMALNGADMTLHLRQFPIEFLCRCCPECLFYIFGKGVGTV